MTSTNPRRCLPARCLPALLLVLLPLAGCQDTGINSGVDTDIDNASAFACDLPATPLHSLPRTLTGGEPVPVDVEGVVAASFHGGMGGLFIQSRPDSEDDKANTPQGAFVALAPHGQRPRVGDWLRLRGVWTPAQDGRHGWRLESVQQWAKCGDSSAPKPVRLSQAPDDWAALEGMLVHIPGPLTVTGNDGLLRFGELRVSFDGRQLVPTQLAPPGDQAQQLAADKARRQLVVDDARNREYPDDFWQLPQPPGHRTPWRAGTVVHEVEGSIEYRHGAWRLQPTREIGRAEQAPRPPAPARDDDALLRVASFNLLNFFNGDGRGGGFPTARGAETPAALERQQRKLIAAMTALDADIIGLMELENDGQGGNSAVAELARKLSRPGDPWQPVIAGARIGSDAIAVGLVYRATRVRRIGPPRMLEGGPFDSASRVPLAQAFQRIPDSEPFTVVVNHFKSKGGCAEATGADRDQGDGQACFNHTRLDSAQRLNAWLQSMDNDGDGDGGSAQVLILGDLNAYAQEDPVRHLLDHGYADLLKPEDHAYVFRGQAGRLNHALASTNMAPRIRQAGVWHINADELPGFAYDGNARGGPDLYAADQWRSSDHDPIWVDLAW
ncbi:MAG: ExeM/NucH family extracellular endonuclease [Xanthomonadales bacterium]|nr:ExeM/NucH family extracellular endonuclease [Xanthomonadales bacterium]